MNKYEIIEYIQDQIKQFGFPKTKKYMPYDRSIRFEFFRAEMKSLIINVEYAENELNFERIKTKIESLKLNYDLIPDPNKGKRIKFKGLEKNTFNTFVKGFN